MPFGPEPMGLAYFAAVKLAGYSAAGYRINSLCKTAKPHPALFGLVRTGLGLAGGVGFGTLALRLGLGGPGPLFYLVLAPVRLGEWLLILWLFYRTMNETRWLGCALAGSAWSYVLDLPAMLALFVLPGGAWIC